MLTTHLTTPIMPPVLKTCICPGVSVLPVVSPEHLLYLNIFPTDLNKLLISVLVKGRLLLFL